jgi:glycosyltransferase involved in cell wall biosynthesis
MRLMYMSRHCMLDRTSGAALTVIELLRRAVQRGLPARTVTGTVFDVNPPRQPDPSDVATWGPVTQDSFGDFELWRVPYEGVENVLLRTQNTGGRRLAQDETDALEDLWEREVEDFQPDVVVMYCGFTPERRMLERLRKRGVKRVLHLANGNYKHAAIFNEVDLIETTSTYLRDFYNKLDGITPWVGAPVIDPGNVVADRHEPRYVTFINPAPAKGATLFYQVAGLAALQIPHAEFLVVESRGHAKGLAEQHGLDLRALPNVTVWPNQRDMRNVYRKTRIALMPSFWTECFGRIIVEAGWNGIPTIGANQGGIPEAMNGGGLALPVPDRCYAKHTSMPTLQEVQPWVDAIAHWLSDADAYAAASRRAKAGAAAFDPDRVVTAILERFSRLVDDDVSIGATPSRMDRVDSETCTVIHVDAGGDGLSILHPAFRNGRWHVVRVSAGTADSDDGPHHVLNAVGDGRARAVQAHGLLRGLDPDPAVLALRAVHRVLDADGYVVLSMDDGDPFNREQLRQICERVGFQQIAVSNNHELTFHAILSKGRRSRQGWEALSDLFRAPREAARGAVVAG